MRVFAFLSSFILLSNLAFSQHAKELEPGIYVVVAAFSPTREDLAINFTESLGKRGIRASYGFNSARKYFYVYTGRYTDRATSYNEVMEKRKEEEFAETWIWVAGEGVTAENVETEPVAEKEETVVASLGSSPAIDPADTIQITDNPPIIQYDHIDLENTEVFLSLYNATNNRIVEGEVKVVDTEKAKLIKEVKGNDYLYLPDPKNKSGQITLICEAFGYRKVQHEMNYPLPLADTVKDYIDLMGTTFIVNFDLVRYQKGDIGTLYNVYFYNDAAVMLPESAFELNSLLEMMNENPGYRIRLHGHTNGNYHGKIILMGPDKNFFSLTGSKNTMGSAKDLARGRAETIREFLISKGIDPTRIEIKSWGGKKPLFDKHSANAKKNVRVEVEVLDQ